MQGFEAPCQCGFCVREVLILYRHAFPSGPITAPETRFGRAARAIQRGDGWVSRSRSSEVFPATAAGL